MSKVTYCIRALGFACFFSSTPISASADPVKQGIKVPPPARACEISPASAYVLADSLGMGLKHAGLEVTLRALLRGPQKISFDGGRSITTPGTHIQKSALESVDADAALISNAKVIIIILGTNLLEADFAESQEQLMHKLKSLAPNAAYFWVDIGATMSTQAQQWSERNRLIYDHAQRLDYQVISRYKAIFGLQANPLQIQAGQLFPGYNSEPGYGGQGNIHGYDLELSQAILDTLISNQEHIQGGMICR
ncbi:MAG: hypothetical protein Q8K34_16120 [Hydrogenophaga sp.]|uniref:hypothetical protein n=1 Tax=Hydrogenophaga sp. TaxID=1904254 RepID=UPI0027264F8F|nr:hypothetical protein [Hydrogenophaga sp.]MDZ4298335.1 hypothetical protein [Moraxellaceae bacterium]MDO9482463.1 hypothetical protein [Hydrogenophaga sp.]MDP2095666.1 hypothetical protein [Hydrogenophaga sp.]MDP2221696.1 hypothetical protein [Hydrogenophaga sp.]MDP3343155.1 hypothetical protein [Hydrogenophaga sp.]